MLGLWAEVVLADEVEALRDRRLVHDRAAVALEDGVHAVLVEGDGAGQPGDVVPLLLLVDLDDPAGDAFQRLRNERMVGRVDEQPARRLQQH